MTLCATSSPPAKYWDHRASFLYNNEIERASSAADPLAFPSPLIGKAVLEKVSVIDHRTRLTKEAKPVVIHQYCSKRRLLNEEDRAYLLYKKISKTTYGSVHVCIVLKKSCFEAELNQWETTEEFVAIKVSSLDRIRAARGKSIEDPFKEASALQFVGNYHRNILGCREVLQSDDYLFVVMDYCKKGDLYSGLLGSSNKHSKVTNKKKPEEATARVWFQQLLQCLVHLENKGIYHGDICLENVLLENESNSIKLIDFGMALRVPYVDPRDDGGVVDASEGTVRRLIRNQGQSGKVTYLAPELVEKVKEFDGFAVDLWSVGIILFIMLVGKAPFECASASDYRFNEINKGPCNLLQNMLWRKPNKRLSLSQVLVHPWVTGFSKPPPYPNHYQTVRELCRDDGKRHDEKRDASAPRRYVSSEGLSP